MRSRRKNTGWWQACSKEQRRLCGKGTTAGGGGRLSELEPKAFGRSSITHPIGWRGSRGADRQCPGPIFNGTHERVEKGDGPLLCRRNLGGASRDGKADSPSSRLEFAKGSRKDGEVFLEKHPWRGGNRKVPGSQAAGGSGSLVVMPTRDGNAEARAVSKAYSSKSQRGGSIEGRFDRRFDGDPRPKASSFCLGRERGRQRGKRHILMVAIKLIEEWAINS